MTFPDPFINKISVVFTKIFFGRQTFPQIEVIFLYKCIVISVRSVVSALREVKFAVQKLRVPESSPHGLVIHVRFVFVFPPQPGHGFGIHQFENAFFSLGPLDIFRASSFVLQQCQ